MPSWIELLLQPGVLFPVAAILFILWLIVRACFKFFPFVSKFVALVNTLVGTEETPGLKKWQEAQTIKLDEQAIVLSEQATVLERVRHQVENDHSSNMRDDQDKIMASVEELKKEFKEHVAIAKAKDKEGDENAYRVAVLADKVNKIQPIVEQLGETWGTKTKNN